jgi:RecA-family ATPase
MNGPNFSANVSSEIPSDNRVQLLRGDEVEIRAVPWLWHEYVAAGRLNLLAGRPGTGKTTVALALAATVTQGGYWPDGTRAPVKIGRVSLWRTSDLYLFADKLSSGGQP